MMRVRPTFTIALLLATLALSACAPDSTTSANAAPASATAYTAMARGTVDVEGGILRVVAQREGRVDAVHAEEGDAVHRGDVLAALDPKSVERAVAVAQAELDQAGAQANLLEVKRAPAEQRARRVAAAAEQGAATGQEADDANAALHLLDAEIAQAKSAVAVAKQRVEGARDDLAARTIRAPVDGRVVRRAVQVGDVVAPSSAPLFEILPNAARIVRAELNEAYVAKVHVGMVADVVTDADEAHPVSARVVRIGEVFGPSRTNDQSSDVIGTRDVACVLSLADSNLRVGQRVLVKFKP